MRALLSTIGSRGDVQPLVALGLALQASGHDARLCVPPDFRDWIESLGLAVTPIGPSVKAFAASRPAAAAPLTAETRRRLIEATVATQFETLTAAARDCDVVVAATALQVAARSVAEKRGIPYAFAAYAPTVLPSPYHAPPPLPPLPGQPPDPPAADNRELWARSDARVHDLFGAALNSHRAALELPPVHHVRRYMFTDQPWLAADATLAPWPDPADQGVVQTGAWILEDKRPLPSDVEQFLAAGDSPVYFGFGSTRAAEGLGSVVVGTARALGRRAVVSRGWAELGSDAGPDCLTVDEVNLQALFPRVAAVVHHGGAGTTTLAALAGTPQVVVPHVYDQHYFARRVEQLGIGVAHERTPTIESLTAALTMALDSAVLDRARVTAGAVRRDGANVAAERIIAGRVLQASAF